MDQEEISKLSEEKAKAINCGDSSILQLVEGLGTRLTSKVLSERVDGVGILSSVLQRVPLSDAECSLLTDFYCDRLNDHHSLIPHVLTGMLAIVQSTNVPAASLQKLLRTLFKEVHCQSQLQVDRRKIFVMFREILSNRCQDIQTMGSEFVLGFIQAIDAEKDPRNLLVVYSCYAIVAKKLNAGPLVEDLFEVIACYFPIDFAPPENNPYGITIKDLQVSLRACMSASPLFAQYCIPLLMEKLDSSMISAKLESLRALVDCCNIYKAEDVEKWLEEIWKNIHREVYLGNSSEVERLACEALASVAKSLNSPITDGSSRSALSRLVELVWKDVQPHLMEPEMKFMQTTAQVLHCVAASSAAACVLVLNRVVPLLFRLYLEKKNSGERKTILGVLVTFLEMGLRGRVAGNEWMQEAFTMCLSAVNEDDPSLRVAAMDGLQRTFVGLDDECKERLASTLLHLIQSDVDASMKDALSGMLRKISVTSPQFIHQSLLTQLLDSLGEPEVPVTILSYVTAVCSCVSVAVVTLPVLLSAHIQAVTRFQTMLTIMSDCAKTQKCLDTVVMTTGILQSVTSSVFGLFSSENPPMEVLDVGVRLLSVMIRKLSLEASSKVCMEFVEWFTSGCGPPIPPHFPSGKGSLLSPDVPLPYALSISVLEAVVGSVSGLVCFPDKLSLMHALSSVSSGSPHSQVRLSASRCYATLLNKIHEHEIVNLHLDAKLKEIETQLQDQKNKSMELLVWCTTALVMRGHEGQGRWVCVLIQRLGDPIHGRAAAEGLGVVLDPDTPYLTTECHANIRFLYRQRFFVSVIDTVVQDYHNNKGNACQSNYLTALAAMLPHLPQQAVQPHLPLVLPLLIQSLLTNDSSLLNASLLSIVDLCRNSPELILPHVSAIIPQLCNLSVFKDMRVRIKAIDSLGCLSNLPAHELLVYKNKVLKKLLPCLDDRKRLVRKEAVRARGKWFLIGAPGGLK